MGTTRKLSNDKTTMQVYWTDKDELSRFRFKVDRAKNPHGLHYESDKDLMKRFTEIILQLAKAKHIQNYTDRLQTFELILNKLNDPNDEPLQTLPWKTHLEEKANLPPK